MSLITSIDWVSKVHCRWCNRVVARCNTLVTNDGATSTDLITLIRMIQQKTLDEYGIIPQPECQLIGFKEYPLLK